MLLEHDSTVIIFLLYSGSSWFEIFATKHCVQVGSTPALHSGGTRFNS
jgi:hypothetical protein